MIAMMLVGGPDILIADEPTSALDVTVQMQVLAILDDLVSERGLGLIFISHDLNLVASFCDRVLIMPRIVGGRNLRRGRVYRAPSVYPGSARSPAAIDGETLFRYCAAIPRGSTCRFLGIHSVTGEGSGDIHGTPQRRRRCSCRNGRASLGQPSPEACGGRSHGQTSRFSSFCSSSTFGQTTDERSDDTMQSPFGEAGPSK